MRLCLIGLLLFVQYQNSLEIESYMNVPNDEEILTKQLIKPIVHKQESSEEDYPLQSSRRDEGKIENKEVKQEVHNLTTGLTTETYNRRYRKGEFRRLLINHDLKDFPLNWIHCHDLVTPYLKGIVNRPKQSDFNINHTMYLRLVHLLKLDTEEYDRQDLYSLLFQISEIPIRMFHWNHWVVTKFLDVLMPGKQHNFKNIKRTVTGLIKKWMMDITDTDMLKAEARVFRPPCFLHDHHKPTLMSHGTKYTTITRTPFTCDGNGVDENGNCRGRGRKKKKKGKREKRVRD